MAGVYDDAVRLVGVRADQIYCVETISGRASSYASVRLAALSCLTAKGVDQMLED